MMKEETGPAPFNTPMDMLSFQEDGSRIHAYSPGFVSVVKAGTPFTEPVGPYNSVVRPSWEFFYIPAVLDWEHEARKQEEKLFAGYLNKKKSMR